MIQHGTRIYFSNTLNHQDLMQWVIVLMVLSYMFIMSFVAKMYIILGLLPLWESVIVLFFVVRYVMFILVLQSS